MSTFSTGNLHHKFTLPEGSPPELIAVIENAVRDVFQRHGPGAFWAPREAAIVHEVGHTIVGTHEGLTIQSVRVFSRPGNAWSGWCAEEEGQWMSNPGTSAENDLSRARVVIAGLAGEAITGLDRPGSSLDEVVVSQLLGHNAAAKLHDPTLSEFHVYAERLWHEQVWGVAIAILRINREPFLQLAKHLQQTDKIKGGKLRSVLAQVRRIAP
jgi:hypothetical protein